MPTKKPQARPPAAPKAAPAPKAPKAARPAHAHLPAHAHATHHGHGPAAKRAPARDPAREVELMRRTFAAMAAVPDDPPGTSEAVMRAIDKERPGRPLFKGYY